MESIFEFWSLAVILLSAFVIGWAAETAQTFIPRALALSILAWLQTLPEFAVEAAIAWDQQRDLMIANLTGSLRLLVGLGWPMIFFVAFFSQRVKKREWKKEIILENQDYLGVLFLFISILYFTLILFKASLTCVDSIFLVAIYIVYLVLAARTSAPTAEEDHGDLPWVGQQIIRLKPIPKYLSVIGLFAIGGFALYMTVHPFIDTLERWAIAIGVSQFVFIQWVAPFLSEFPEKVSAFNWARQSGKAPMAVMNMVNSNINQWTVLAAMIPLVFSLSLGRFEPVLLDSFHQQELALTIAQSAVGGLILLDLRFSVLEALGIFVLWLIQFVKGDLRVVITGIYGVWFLAELIKVGYLYQAKRHVPLALAMIFRRQPSDR
jgi:cation:H+ antiporter